jgi:hypothetical protein
VWSSPHGRQTHEADAGFSPTNPSSAVVLQSSARRQRILKKNLIIFVAGILVGTLATVYIPAILYPADPRIRPEDPGVCYSCIWEDAALRKDLINFYRQYRTPDRLVAADVMYILWRATEAPNCDALKAYARVSEQEQNPARRLSAETAVAFGDPECGFSGSKALTRAAKAAQQDGRNWEATALRELSKHKFRPRFQPQQINTSLHAPPNATTMILGESTIVLTPNLRIGTQVDRVARDWISYQMKWNLTDYRLAAESILWYHEGAAIKKILELVSAQVYPLSGTLAVNRDGKWFAPDDTGLFRFELLDDKMEYPTSHASGGFGWIEDTHGISALVSQALERRMELVVGCGDAEGKAQAAFYLAQKGVNVWFPGDRYQDLLLGYEGKGVLMGTAPVKKVEGTAVVGHQPVRFLLTEPIVVEDTKQIFPVQYYDAAARYFRRLSGMVPLKLDYVNVDAADQIGRVIARAHHLRSSAIAVRVATKAEDAALRTWLTESPRNRAILFHSGLYAYAQPLFESYPSQVTFGDLHPRFQ